MPVSQSLAKTAPNSLEAEEGVIGAVLTDPDMYYRVAEIVSNGAAFFYGKCRLIWDAMKALVDQSQPIDFLLLAEHLKNRREFEDVGGLSYLTQLVANTSSPRYAQMYAELVKRAYIRRQMMQKADHLHATAANEDLNTESLETIIESALTIYATLKPDTIKHISVAAEHHMDMVNAAKDSPGSSAIMTGLRDLDDAISGLHKRKLIVAAGLSHHGKTALLLEIAINAAKEGQNVAYFNVADGDEVDVMNRLATMESGIYTKKLVMGTVSNQEHSRYVEAMGKIANLPLYIKSQKGMSPGQVHAECKILADKRGNPIRPDIIIIDYIQRMYRVNFKGNRREELMSISQHLTRIGDESHFDCPVVVGAQIRKSALGKEPPTMFDIQECGDIAQDADVVLIVWQKSLVDDACEFPNQFDIIVNKNKQTGARAAVSCFFDKAIARIVDGVTHDVDLGDHDHTPHYADEL